MCRCREGIHHGDTELEFEPTTEAQKHRDRNEKRKSRSVRQTDRQGDKQSDADVYAERGEQKDKQTVKTER